MTSNLKYFCNKLGHSFEDPTFLEAALTHRSVPGINNERKEFLGDSIVNYVIAEALYHKFPEAKEGELSRLRANLVRGETLAEVAAEYEVGDHLRLGPGEMKSGGFRRASILADALEAIIAAIYLDSDMDNCRKVILNWYQSRLDETSLADTKKDAKTQLQELLQSKQLALPTYTVVDTKGVAHKQMFIVSCTVTGLPDETRGTGTSRRRAEQEAAENYLNLLKQDA